MSDKRVLIAEDDPSLLEMLRLTVVDVPFQVVYAIDGNQALLAYRAARADNCPFDLLVLDVMMPKMSGLKVAETIREEGDLLTRIVLWTGEDSPIVEMRAFSANVEATWPKVNEACRLSQQICLALGLSAECE